MKEVIGIIPSKFRRRGIGVACTLLLRAGLNFLGLAMLLPVLALVLDPRSLSGSGPLARVYAALGFTSPHGFALAVCASVVGVIVLKCLANLYLARVERNYIYDLYRTLSRRLYITYHDRGLPFVKQSNSAVLARNVNVVCLAFTAGVLKPAAAIAAEAMLLALLFGALVWYAPIAAALAVAVFLPSIWIYYGLVRNRINRYGELENKAQREKARLVAETFRGYADIEINNAFPMMLRAFDRAMDQVIRTRLRETAIGMLPQAFTEIGLALGMALLVALSLGAEQGRGQLLFGVFAVAALRLMPSVRSIMAAWTAIKYNRYTIDILRDATACEQSDAGTADTPPSPAANIRPEDNPKSTDAAPHSGPDGDKAPAAKPDIPAATSDTPTSALNTCSDAVGTEPRDTKPDTPASAAQPGPDGDKTLAAKTDTPTSAAHPGTDGDKIPAAKTDTPTSATHLGTDGDKKPAAKTNTPTSAARNTCSDATPDIPASAARNICSDTFGAERRDAKPDTSVPDKLPAAEKTSESTRDDDAPGIRPPEKLPFEREIAVQVLGFRFADDGRELFRGLTLSIRKGERIGIRGASGAGKTTLFNLLLGLYEPTSGQITIDGTPLTAANRRAWQNRIGYVSQNLFIADGSFAANVALGVPDAAIDRNRVAQALDAARLGDFVAGLAKGMDTHVGECGCRLSGGQRQRIGIARALYRRADVLFFDEATSALDSRTEEEINRSIAQLAARDKGLTLVVIAHRESSLEYCNRIITIGE